MLMSCPQNNPFIYTHVPTILPDSLSRCQQSNRIARLSVLLLYQGGGAGGPGLGGAGGAGTTGGSGGANEQLNIQNLQSILQNMGFSAQEQVRSRFYFRLNLS